MLHIQSEISLSDTSHVNANYAADESDRRHQDAFVLAFGMRGSHIGGFEDAKHVTCLTNGRLLISDYINSRLQVCTTKGGCLAVLDKDVKFPWAAVLTPDNNIAVTLCTERCVRIYSMDGDLLQMFGENLFVCPTGIACDDKGRMIVCDAKTDKVSVFDKYGNFVRFLGNFDRVEETFSKPGYVCISVNGDIIISDSGNHKIKVFDAECNFVKAFGSFGRGDGQFKCPYDVATNVFGNIFVADHYNSRISVFTRDGVFIRHMLCSKHGLLHPQGVTVTTDNHLVVTHGHLKATEILVFRLAIESTKPYRCDIIEYV
ncbi:tripartite motif-containing protein 2-like [Dreissena polymorpha]|uniref:Uncharacterized protein n=1 Tax=Dreissena polymorpha TaxID=45954 RepID=A0A9D4H288_DREPO|nr:tripartite motif-containing protein 2-like [Dreissena polymorpha]KAH3827037.1 hypothetical protein DPMN_128965 [Dreissena polymorpha]